MRTGIQLIHLGLSYPAAPEVAARRTARSAAMPSPRRRIVLQVPARRHPVAPRSPVRSLTASNRLASQLYRHHRDRRNRMRVYDPRDRLIKTAPLTSRKDVD